MDLSTIDFNFIELFSTIYSSAQIIFKEDPLKATAQKQKKIRRWIEKKELSGLDLPKSAAPFIAPAVEDADFIAFFKACDDHIKQHGTYQKQLFDRHSAALSKEVQAALWELIDEGHLSTGSFEKRGEDAIFRLDFGGGDDRLLILKNATGLPNGHIDALTFSATPALCRKEEGYCLFGIGENWEEEIEIPFSIFFTDAELEVYLYRADEALFGGTPWDHLLQIATDILAKRELPGAPLNALEQEALPLLYELAKLTYWAKIPKEYQESGFPLLKAEAEALGFPELPPRFDAIKSISPESFHAFNSIGKLLSTLNLKKYEPLWRALFERIQKTQEDYPSRKEQDTALQKERKEARRIIDKQLKAHGFEGEFPHYYRFAPMRSLHFANSYDISYLAGWHPRAAFHIHCIEEPIENGFIIEFLCGNALLRKGEQSKDIWACLFNAKGRSFYQHFFYQFDGAENSMEELKRALPIYTQVAAKRAELAPLTKAERKELCGFDGAFSAFLLPFLLMGGLFGLFMTLGMMLFAIIMGFFEGQSPAYMLQGFPWLMIFLLSWILFGGAMGLISAFASRK